MAKTQKVGYDQSEPHSTWIGISILLFVLVLAGIFIWGIYYYRSAITRELDQKEITRAPISLIELRNYEYEQLHTGTIPIDRAMKRVVREYSK